MLIIVEGVDRTGKSTLCESSEGEVFHFDKPRTQDPLDEYLGPLWDYRPGTGRDVWVDRHYLGELVWPSIFDRPSIHTPRSLAVIERHLKAAGAVCVLAVRDPDDLEEACQDEPCAGRAREAQHLFMAAARASSLPWVLYDHGNVVRASLIAQLGAINETVAKEWL